MRENVVTATSFLMGPALQMAFELAFAPHGYVANDARLRSFFCEFHPCLVLLALEVGLATLGGVEIHAASLHLYLSCLRRAA